MKGIILMIFMSVMLFSANTYAQEGKPIKASQSAEDPIAKAAIFTERMRTELALNDEQVAKVKPINEQYYKSKIAAKSNNDEARINNLKQEAVTLRNESLKNVLSTDQYNKFLAMVAKPTGSKSETQ